MISDLMIIPVNANIPKRMAVRRGQCCEIN